MYFISFYSVQRRYPVWFNVYTTCLCELNQTKMKCGLNFICEVLSLHRDSALRFVDGVRLQKRHHGHWECVQCNQWETVVAQSGRLTTLSTHKKFLVPNYRTSIKIGLQMHSLGDVRQVSCIFAHLHICIFCQIEIHLKFFPETSLRISSMPRVAIKYILFYALEHLIEKLTFTREITITEKSLISQMLNIRWNYVAYNSVPETGFPTVYICTWNFYGN